MCELSSPSKWSIMYQVSNVHHFHNSSPILLSSCGSSKWCASIYLYSVVSSNSVHMWVSQTTGCQALTSGTGCLACVGIIRRPVKGSVLVQLKHRCLTRTHHKLLNTLHEIIKLLLCSTVETLEQNTSESRIKLSFQGFCPGPRTHRG